VETLVFHPKEEDKVLAYTKEGKVKLDDEDTVCV